jgi:iron-sulfur cluster repair protein YtfE (RIC family)
MNGITDFMTQHHRECDELFAATEESVANGNWDKAYGEFNLFLKEMGRHFAMEEDVLFPAFDLKTGMEMGPTFVMRSEHKQMLQVIDGMAKAVAAKDADGYLGLAETLMILTQQHNMKEEQMLYRMMDQELAADAKSLLERVHATA